EIVPAVLDVPVVGGSGATTPPNVETLTALSPDIVIVYDQLGYRGALEAAGLRVADWTLGREEDMQHLLGMVADLLGKPERGEAINGWRSGVLADLAAATDALP